MKAFHFIQLLPAIKETIHYLPLESWLFFTKMKPVYNVQIEVQISDPIWQKTAS
jgi:hypothetical protein